MEYFGVEEEAATVVGDLSVNITAPGEDHFIVGSVHDNHFSQSLSSVKATPSVRALAKRLAVDINHIRASSPDGRITSMDVEKAAQLNAQKGASQALKGVRKSMARVMSSSHEQVVPVTLHDDVDIFRWPKDEDASMRLVHAIAVACKQEPALNVWFDGEQLTRRLLNKVDLGIAVDTKQGLFVPVLRQVQSRSESDLLAGLTALKEAVVKRNIPPAELTGATMILSNYGALNPVCRYGTPIVVPPMVAIIGMGAMFDDVNHEKTLPISLTFDHRCVTGGEAARFMGYIVEYLNEENSI